MATPSTQAAALAPAGTTAPPQIAIEPGTVSVANADRKRNLTIGGGVAGALGIAALAVALIGGRGQSRPSTPVLLTGVGLLVGGGGTAAAGFMSAPKEIAAAAVNLPSEAQARRVQATMGDRITSVVQDVKTGRWAVIDKGQRQGSAPYIPNVPPVYVPGYLPDYGPGYYDPHSTTYRDRYYTDYGYYPDYNYQHYHHPEYETYPNYYDTYPSVPYGGTTSSGDSYRYPDPSPSYPSPSYPSSSYPSSGDSYPRSTPSPAPAPAPTPYPPASGGTARGDSSTNGNPRGVR